MNDNFFELEQDMRRHYVWKKSLFAVLLGLLLLAFALLGPIDSPARSWLQDRWQATQEQSVAILPQVQDDSDTADEDEAYPVADAAAGTSEASENGSDGTMNVTADNTLSTLVLQLEAEPGAQLDVIINGKLVGTAEIDPSSQMVWRDSDPTADTPTVNWENLDAGTIDPTELLQLEGTTDPNREIAITIDGDEYARVTADSTGAWSYEGSLTALKPGDHELTAAVVNEAGEPTAMRQTIPFAIILPSANQKNLAEVVMSEPDLSLLDTAINAADVQTMLTGNQSVTLFAPSDSAFGQLPPALVRTLIANPAVLRELLLHHVVAGTLPIGQAENRTLTSVGGTPVKVEAVGESLTAANGILYKIDSVLLPPTNAQPPIIDASGVPVFSGTFLTVVGTGTPGSSLYLTSNGTSFGETTVRADGSWLVDGDIKAGTYQLIAYAVDDQLMITASDPLLLEVSE